MHRMPTRRRTAPASLTFVAAAAGIACACGPARAVVFGQLDDFENGTVMDWRHGNVSLTNPVNVPDGGPNGAGDNFMRNNSVGGGNAHSRQVIFNQQQWLGNYNAAGITRITGFMNNLGSTALFMRVAIEGAASQFSSTTAVPLPAGSGWRAVTFDLTPSSLTRVSGTAALGDVLNGVNTLRILSAQSGPAWRGDALVSTVGVDALRAMRLPGDANFDGVVNLDDFNVLASNFGTHSGATWQQADFDFNGVVNLDDFNLLAANFGQTIAGPGAVAVPEPVCGGTVALVAAGVLRRTPRAARVRYPTSRSVSL